MSTRLSLAYRDLEEIPEHVINNYSHITELDLSSNLLTYKLYISLF